MKRKFTISIHLSLLMLFISALAIGQIQTPMPSPPGSVSTIVGLTDIQIDYYRPGVKGRQIFGEGDDYLQPYGQIWRTGANSGSKITLSTAVTVAGEMIEPGEYLIFTIPGKDEWQFMLYSDLSIGGNVGAYDESNEVMRAKVKPMKNAQMVETLTFNISDISEDNTVANIHLAWENVSIKVPVKVDYDEQVMKEIASKTKVNPVNYIQAANYYYNTDKELEKALEWVNKYLEDGENFRQFWNVHLKARILAKMGEKDLAIKAAEMSMEQAMESPNGDFGYIKRNKELIEELKKK